MIGFSKALANWLPRRDGQRHRSGVIATKTIAAIRRKFQGIGRPAPMMRLGAGGNGCACTLASGNAGFMTAGNAQYQRRLVLPVIRRIL